MSYYLKDKISLAFWSLGSQSYIIMIIIGTAMSKLALNEHDNITSFNSFHQWEFVCEQKIKEGIDAKSMSDHKFYFLVIFISINNILIINIVTITNVLKISKNPTTRLIFQRRAFTCKMKQWAYDLKNIFWKNNSEHFLLFCKDLSFYSCEGKGVWLGHCDGDIELLSFRETLILLTLAP